MQKLIKKICEKKKFEVFFQTTFTVDETLTSSCRLVNAKGPQNGSRGW